ncbi:hypothetical protein N7523_010035 [Penicillium sp. IBT 18751x]|nr:hypothetical protein N7523_010035 [Penicillium sp. IBT 18751x]
MFALVCSLMAARFNVHGGLLQSLSHDREGLFFPTFWLSIATMITGLERYFGDNQSTGVFKNPPSSLFWIYCACTFAVAVFQYSYLFTSVTYPLQTMMPLLDPTSLPIMLSGTIASVIVSSSSHSAIPIITAGIAFQGPASASASMYSHYIGRLMESGLPSRESLIGMAQGLPTTLSVMGSEDTEADVRMLAMLALAAAVFLWALSLWFFCVMLLVVIRSPPTAFHLSWWAMVFPNTGFTLATITLGKSFESAAINWFGSAMSLCVITSVVDIMYPGKDEDCSE